MILDEKQASLLAGTSAADADGNALVLHHGTLHSFDRFEHTADFGFHFGTLEQAQRRLRTMTKEERQKEGAGEPRIVSVALAVKNPLIIPHDPKHWGVSYMADIMERFLTRAERVALKGFAPAKEADPKAAYQAGQAMIKNAILRAGYDSILYRNRYEITGPRGSIEWSWVALDARDIVHLGENLDTKAAAFPDGFAAGPAADPEKHVSLHGGLRTRTWELARVKDIRLFQSRCMSAVEEACGPRKWWNRPGEKGHALAYWSTKEVTLKIEIDGEPGRMSVEALPRGVHDRLSKREPVEDIVASLPDQSGFENLLDELSSESDVFRCSYQWGRDGKPDLLTVGKLQVKWHPGEPVDVAIGRLEDNLEPLVQGLRALAKAESNPQPGM